MTRDVQRCRRRGKRQFLQKLKTEPPYVRSRTSASRCRPEGSETGGSNGHLHARAHGRLLHDSRAVATGHRRRGGQAQGDPSTHGV